MTLSRRGFFAGTIGGAWTMLLSSAACAVDFVAPSGAEFHSLGLGYLAAGGRRTRAAALLRQLSRMERRSGRTIGRLMAERRTEDFRSGNTVLVDRWIVSESEALFCAVLVMSGTADA